MSASRPPARRSAKPEGETTTRMTRCQLPLDPVTGSELRDMTEELERGLVRSWSKLEMEEVLRRLQRLDPGSTWDWDFDAGEEWARVLRDWRASFFVWARGPLVIAACWGPPCSEVLERSKAIVVRVPEMDASCLSADRTTLVRFAGRNISDALDDRRFSADDLVWATI